MRIVFMGTEDFGLPALKRLARQGNEVAGVVSTPPRQRGRGLRLADSPVAAWARETGCGPVLTPERLNDPAFLSELRARDADLFVVAAFRILPPDVFAMPRLGTVNIHASLLPRYRGPAPIQRAIEAGETETGVTIFKIDRGIDTGGIILSKATAIGEEETTPELYARLRELGADALAEAVSLLERGKATCHPQDERHATKAPKLLKEEAVLDFEEHARVLYNRVRAFKPFPGTYTMLNGRRLGVEWAHPLESPGGRQPGTVCGISGDSFDIQCGRSVLRVLEVKPEGRKRMDAGAYLRGARLETGTVLG
ncbi:MAG: methionyl-tRNA formyltransferase [Chitinivibrionales bacterium]|nr:methionyl-tRNA formyltransferase [Chitinivibrionales bacterium]MBD3395053.1 methionyl-tRNA formyltransferase [Chitinivibrionales bacterium]